jgi:hypothetical protein
VTQRTIKPAPVRKSVRVGAPRERADDFRQKIDAPEGWGGILQLYAQAV